MNNQNIATDLVLKPKENIIFSCSEVAVTNFRILVRPPRSITDLDINNWNFINTEECKLPSAKNGGKESKKEAGHKLTGIGFAMLFFQIVPFFLFDINIINLFGAFSGFIESFYFLTTMIAITAGAYFLIITYLYTNPHTSLLFSSFLKGNKPLLAIFPGWDNSEAEKVISAIRRVQRKI